MSESGLPKVKARRLEIMPIGCCRLPLSECPPGLFLYKGTLGFKSEYLTEEGNLEVYVAQTGEAFWGGTTNHKARGNLLVTPVLPSWQPIE